MLSTIQKFISVLSAALGLMVTIGSLVGDDILVRGASAFEDAVNAENKAQQEIEAVQDRLAGPVLEAICDSPDSGYDCEVPGVRETAGDVALKSIQLGTIMVIQDGVRNVGGPDDARSSGHGELDTSLIVAIGNTVQGKTGVGPRETADTLNHNTEFFGAHNDNKYARLVSVRITSTLTKNQLQGTPNLIQRPEPWQLWMVRFGLAGGGVMLGASGLYWSRRIRFAKE